MSRGLKPALVTMAALAWGCSSASPSSSPPATTTPLPSAMAVVEVTMTEYRFDYAPPAVGGRVLFRVVNRGREAHSLALQALPEDLPPIDEQVHGSVRRFLPALAGVPTQRPGQRSTFAVDLQPGVRYALICYLPAPDGAAHALKGMNAEFRAGPRPG